MNGKFHLATVRPNIDTAGATAYAAADLLFDWHPFEIPRGGCSVKSLQMLVHGTEGADANGLDMELLFAKSINGVAPPSLGTANAAMAVATNVACKNHIIGYKFLDGSALIDVGKDLISYNLWADATGDETHNRINMTIQGDPTYAGTTVGYQTIWIAGIAQGAFDFGTGVILDETDAATLAAAGTAALDVDGVDARIVFAPGDEIIAQDGALIGTIKTVNSDVLITLEAVHTDALADDDELCFRGPIVFNFGIEY